MVGYFSQQPESAQSSQGISLSTCTNITALLNQLGDLIGQLRGTTGNVRDAADALFGPLPDADEAKGVTGDSDTFVSYLERLGYVVSELQQQVRRFQ